MNKPPKPVRPDALAGDAGISWEEDADQRVTAAIDEISRKNQDKVRDDLSDDPEYWEASNIDLTHEDIEVEYEPARHRAPTSSVALPKKIIVSATRPRP